MSGGTIRAGAIIAAGEGRRLRGGGRGPLKPLVPVGGVPLLEHVVGNFAAAGVTSLSIIFSEEGRECADLARRRFPDLDLAIQVETTPSSLVSFRRVLERAAPGRVIVSTVDAYCPREDFVRFVRAAERAAAEATLLAVTPFVADEKPLWVRRNALGRVMEIGGPSGDAVTTGIYAVSERARELSPPPGLGRLREFLAWLASSGERIEAVEIAKVVDVDRPEDVALAEAMARPGASGRGRRRVGERPRCWGVYRELAHSPGRETDDAEILRATARRLSALGFEADLKSSDELPESENADVPPFLFVMCEREWVVGRLAAWERRGRCVVNRPEGIRNTDRNRAIALLPRAGVPFPASVLVATGAHPADPGIGFPCWIKRGDLHATEPGDVSFAAGPEQLERRLASLAARGITRAVVQEHIPGDLIKFYGVAGQEEGEPLSWFQWFYHRDQRLANHSFEAAALVSAVSRAAAALGLEVFGGDAIATAEGRVVLIDLNAWPSFALYREIASARIAEHLAARFRKEVEVSK